MFVEIVGWRRGRGCDRSYRREREKKKQKRTEIKTAFERLKYGKWESGGCTVLVVHFEFTLGRSDLLSVGDGADNYPKFGRSFPPDQAGTWPKHSELWQGDSTPRKQTVLLLCSFLCRG